MRKYCIRMLEETNFGGSKAKLDINKTLEKLGYIELKIPRLNSLNSILKMLKTMLFTIKWHSTVVIHSPLGLKFGVFVFLICKIKRLKVIVFIHDIEELRKIYIKNKYQIMLERSFFQCCDALICHNQNMKDYLINSGIKKEKIITITIFDYLLNYDIEKHSNIEKNKVVIAGNLSMLKGPYIYLLDQLDLRETEILLYGIEYEKEKLKNKNIKYMGAYPSDDIPKHLLAGWGLAWDGDSLGSCTGATGAYLPYCNQHKVSLYLASGLPVIIWEKAGLASFIKQNEAGITIDSLTNLEEVLSRVTEEQYALMKHNAMNISGKLRSGHFAGNAIKRAEEMVLNQEGKKFGWNC